MTGPASEVVHDKVDPFVRPAHYTGTPGRSLFMRHLSTLAALTFLSTAHAQLAEHQIEYLAHLNCELNDAWTISNLHRRDMQVGGRKAHCFSADLYTAKSNRQGNNEGVSLYFFAKDLRDSLEVEYMPTEDITYEFMFTESFVVVVSYSSSNGDQYDIRTRRMLPDLRNYFSNWYTRY